MRDWNLLQIVLSSILTIRSTLLPLNTPPLILLLLRPRLLTIIHQMRHLTPKIPRLKTSSHQLLQLKLTSLLPHLLLKLVLSHVHALVVLLLPLLLHFAVQLKTVAHQIETTIQSST